MLCENKITCESVFGKQYEVEERGSYLMIVKQMSISWILKRAQLIRFGDPHHQFRLKLKKPTKAYAFFRSFKPNLLFIVKQF